MSTRSRIGYLNENGKVYSIYCHLDGYPEGVGFTLLDHYQDRRKVMSLVDLGDISWLGESVEFSDDDPKGTRDYHRWRGDDICCCTSSLSDYLFTDAPFNMAEDYVYLFMFGVWFYKKYDGWVQLRKEDFKE